LRPECPDAPEGRDVLDATSLTRTRLTTAWGVRKQLPRCCAFGRSAPGHRAAGSSCYGIFVPDEEGQGINLLDAARVFRTPGVKKDGVRTTPATVPRVQTQLSRHNASRRSYQGTTRPDPAVKPQRVRTQLSTHYASGRSCRGICLPDEECHGNCAQDAAHF